MRKALLLLLLLLAVPAASAADSAVFQTYEIYKNPLDVGVRYSVGIGFKNTGDTTWTRAGGYELEVVEGIGSYCTGIQLDESDNIASNQVKIFELSCIPMPDEVGETTIRAQMKKSGVPFGEVGTIDVFEVEDNCRDNAVDGICNKYCGADDECHGYNQDDINKDGFCSETCAFMDSPPPGWKTTTTSSTTTTEKTTTTSSTTTTLPCTLTEGLREDGLCSVSCGASAYCDNKKVDAAGCLNCGVQFCGNGQVDGTEQCDTSVGAGEWKCEPLLCNGAMSRGFITCKKCVCSYYENSCMPGRCGAECSKDSECDDYDMSTQDTCNMSSCMCHYAAKLAPAKEGAKESAPEEKQAGSSNNTLITAGLVLLLVALAVILVKTSRKKGEKAK